MSIKEMEERLDAQRIKEESDNIIREIEVCKEFHRRRELERREPECEHSFELMRPRMIRICIHCGEESSEKIYSAEKKDLLRYQLTFKKAD